MLLALLRGLHLAAALSLLGVIGFIAWVLPAARDRGPAYAPLIRLWRCSGIAALLTSVAWFAVQSANIADATGLNEVAAALPAVAERTRYGNLMMVRAALLLAATLLAGDSRLLLYLALGLAAVALGLQGLIGHAGAIGGRIGAGIVASETLHLCAAGLWVGALVPLWLCVAALPQRSAAAICERFSPIGLGCVLVIAGTGLLQGLELIGGPQALFDTPYGQIALFKIGLFLLALALAAVNRLWLTDRLSRSESGARTLLRLSIAGETLIGLAIIMAAGFLASSMPGQHASPA
jgi:putative copper export protein